MPSKPAAGDTLALYQRQAEFFDHNRDRSLFERNWLDKFTGQMAIGSTILDLGCGMGEPIAEHLIGAGFNVTGVDGAPAMIEKCLRRFPSNEWINADMRGLDLKRQFDGIIAWDSFFHLTGDEQRAMFEIFTRHASPGARLMFTAGPDDGEVWGHVGEEPVHHASLAPTEYRRLFDAHGWDVIDYGEEDPDCAEHTIWLARKRAD